MRCDYCGSEMELNENMYICANCFTTYIYNDGAIIKRYVVPKEFAVEYIRNKSVFTTGNTDNKIDITKKLLQIYSNCPALWNLLGVLSREKNNNEDAIKCYEKALNLNPNYIQVLVNVAIAYYKMNDLEMANRKMENAYNKMSTTALNYEIMLGNYALIAGKLGNKEKAIKLINEAEARGYKNGDLVRKEIGIASNIRNDFGKSFFSKLKENRQRAREEEAIKKAYQVEIEKRKPHTKRMRYERNLTPQEQHSIDMIEMERDAKIAQWYKEGVGFFEAAFVRALPYDNKIEEIRNRAVWYEDVVIPPEIDPLEPISIDEEAIRHSVRK